MQEYMPSHVNITFSFDTLCLLRNVSYAIPHCINQIFIKMEKSRHLQNKDRCMLAFLLIDLKCNLMDVQHSLMYMVDKQTAIAIIGNMKSRARTRAGLRASYLCPRANTDVEIENCGMPGGKYNCFKCFLKRRMAHEILPKHECFTTPAEYIIKGMHQFKTKTNNSFNKPASFVFE